MNIINKLISFHSKTLLILIIILNKNKSSKFFKPFFEIRYIFFR